jgi:ankyrin repeat protein
MSLFSRLFKPMPFLDAVMAGKVGDVRKHLDAGVNPNTPIEGGTTYPLHYAVHSGVETVDLLIRHGADVNVRSQRGGGKTALHLAAAGGYLDVVALLLKAGADMNAADNYGHTPMFDAAVDVSAYDMIYATMRVAPSDGAIRERSGRGAVVALLRSLGAVASAADIETAKAMGSLPEAERQSRHMTLAHNRADFEYHRAVREVSMEYLSFAKTSSRRQMPHIGLI